jgi:hypothetical protein
MRSIEVLWGCGVELEKEGYGIEIETGVETGEMCEIRC